MPELRKLTENDFDQSLELSQYAFQYTVAEEEKPKRREQIRRHEVWGVFEEKKLTSKLHLLPFTIFIGNQLVKMGGVAGVATWPEYRRNGSVSRLVDVALTSMKEKGQVISFLHPFDIDFYRRFGWELCFTQKRYEIEKSNLHFMEGVSGSIRRLSINEDVELLNDLYEEYAKKYNGMLKRETYWWENNVNSTGIQFAVYFNSRNEPLGYISYKVSDKVMDVEEFIYLDSEARVGLWNFICQHDSMIEKVKMVTQEDENLHFLLKNPKVKIELVPYFMARIVDVEGFLKQYEFQNINEKVVLHIQDHHKQWNNVSVQIEGGVVSNATLDDEGLTMSINSLTAVLLSNQTAMFLYEAGKIKGKRVDVQTLGNLIRMRPTSLLDFF